MAKLSSSTIGLVLTISCLLVASTADVDATSQGSVAEEDSDFLREVCGGKEKVIRIRFYVQDLAKNQPNTTVYEVARASITSTSPTSFGSVSVIDDLVTEGPEADSRPLGRIQGVNTRSDLSVIGITVSLNIYFTAGRFNGSTISFIGRNEFFQPARELPIAGGSGAFRFARGYAIQSTYSMTAKVYVLEFNVYTTYNTKFVEPLQDTCTPVKEQREATPVPREATPEPRAVDTFDASGLLEESMVDEGRSGRPKRRSQGPKKFDQFIVYR